MRTGHRRVTAETIAAETMAAQFDGLPAGITYLKALDIVHKSAGRLLRGKAYTVFSLLLQLNERQIKQCPSDYDPSVDFTRFVAWATNETIAGEVETSVRNVQRILATLVEKGLVWMNDQNSRKRTPMNGICLLPGFARLAELKEQIEAASLKRAADRILRREFLACSIAITALDNIEELAGDTALKDLAEICRRYSKGPLPHDAAAKLFLVQQRIAELKASVVNSLGFLKLESSQDDKNVTLRTYKFEKIKKEVRAWREEESAQSESNDPTLEPVESGVKPPPLLTPRTAVVAKSLKRMMLSRSVDFLPQGNMEDSRYVSLCARSAAARIKLSRDAIAHLEERFGQAGANVVLLQAAYDPKIRYPAAWAAHFARSPLGAKPVDMRPSFFRMVKDLGEEPGPPMQ